ncbi:hypothetical protein CBM2626_A10137 [Cupriavidus taiwanensis]|nr:hypothetical protein CBM2626_A10137 [Cupriavidus taiwanensis]
MPLDIAAHGCRRLAKFGIPRKRLILNVQVMSVAILRLVCIGINKLVVLLNDSHVPGRFVFAIAQSL